MSVRVSDLTHVRDKTKLDNCVEDMKKSIDKEIVLADANGNFGLIYALPETLTGFTLPTKKLQTYIYAKLIEHYKSCGFTVQLTQNTFKLVLKWPKERMEAEFEAMRQLINKHLVKDDDSIDRDIFFK